MKARVLIILISLFLVNIQSFTQNIADNGITKDKKLKEEYSQIKNIVDSGHFEFTANKVIPLGYEPVYLPTNENFLKISGEKANAYLPFYGNAYNVAYTQNQGGINFSGQMQNYLVNSNDKKNSVTVHFDVSKNNDLYECTLDISAGGYATLGITSQNHAYISYYGTVKSTGKSE